MDTNGISPNLARWLQRLKGLSVAPLTRDYPEPPSEEVAKVKRPIEGVESLAGSESLSRALRTLHSLGNSYELFLTAYVILISRLTGDEDVALGTNAEPDGLTCVLCVELSAEDTFSHLASKVKDVGNVQVEFRSSC
jgi:L-2-aminoadipate reductase